MKKQFVLLAIILIALFNLKAQTIYNLSFRNRREIDPNVEQMGYKERGDKKLEVNVHQVAKDLHGNIFFDGMVKHIYTFQDRLIKSMDTIE
jgi:hypothetical protein